MKKHVLFLMMIIVACCASTLSQSWQNLNAPPGITIVDINRNNNSIFGTANGSAIHRSVDGGANWTTATTEPAPSGMYTYQHFTCTNSGALLVGLLDYSMTYGTLFPLLRSTDNGDSWTYIAPFMYSTSRFYNAPNNYIYALANSSYSTSLCVSSDDGFTFTVIPGSFLDVAIAANNDIYAIMVKSAGENKLSKSTDGGTTWSDLTATGMPALPNRIILCPNGNIFVTDGSNSNPVVRSTDGGSTFSTIGEIFPLIWNDYNNNVFGYKASGNQTYRSTNQGGTWQALTPNLTLPYVIAHPDGNVYAYSSGNIYKLSGTSGIDDNSAGNSGFEVFPNPSNGKFEVRGKQHPISGIEIINASGESVMRQQTSGNIDLSGSHKGIYILKVYIGAKSYTSKIIIQ